MTSLPTLLVTFSADLVPHRTARDPRFLEGSVPKGLREAESEAARKRYAFVYDDLLPGERTALQDKLKVRREQQRGRGGRSLHFHLSL